MSFAFVQKSLREGSQLRDGSPDLAALDYDHNGELSSRSLGLKSLKHPTYRRPALDMQLFSYDWRLA